jgi:hypothetical protein
MINLYNDIKRENTNTYNFLKVKIPNAVDYDNFNKISEKYPIFTCKKL